MTPATAGRAGSSRSTVARTGNNRPTVDRPVSRAGRPRDAGASRQALLEAAQELFGQHGFEGTTVRDIGDRAGVDPALIARYFGSKADLYVAAVAAERMDEGQPAEYERLAQMVETLVTRTDNHGPGPIMQALIRSDTSEEIRDAARARLARRLVDPLAAGMTDQGLEHAELRAELAVSALIGISLGRSLGWFGAMQSVPARDVIDLVSEALGPLAGDAAPLAGDAAPLAGDAAPLAGDAAPERDRGTGAAG